jgi:hypothetical protein
MFSRYHGKPHTETYWFTATPTLSDFPLPIGEMLRLSDLRSKRQASHRSLFQKIKSRPIAQFRTRTSPAWKNNMKIGIIRAERIL